MTARIRPDDCVLVCIDVQERFMPVLDRKDLLISNIIKLAMTASEFGIPLVVTEQNPKGLGSTVDDINMLLGEHDYYEKDSFSCFKDEVFKRGIGSKGKKQIIFCGIETQVCVLQSALDALDEGYEVFVVGDAVDSRKSLDRELALERMRQAGVIVEAAESILFYLMDTHKDEKFKKVQWIVKSF